MGEVIPLPKREPPTPGNGAREALIDVAMGLWGSDAGVDDGAAKWSDWILMELWMRGFHLVPLPDDAP